MKPFEFVLIIISVIIGLILTEFAITVAYMIQRFPDIHFYWPHLVMSAFGLISILNYWATLYRLRKIERWTVGQIGLVFFTALIFFIVTHICFPDPETFNHDYETYFHKNAKSIFALMVCFLVAWLFEVYLIRKVRQIRKYTMMIVFIIMGLAAILIDHPMWYGITGSIMLVMQLAYMYRLRTYIEER